MSAPVKVRRFGLAVVLIAGFALARLAAQPAQQPPTFRTEVEYVEVDAIVTDREGRFVRDLTKEDFQVLEDGRPQAVTGFTLIDLPVARYDRPLYSADPIEPDVTSNERPFEGRVYVMVVDDLHINFARTPLARRAAREFIERAVGANDLMAVVHTAGSLDNSQEFTSNKRLLLAAVDKANGLKLQSATVNKAADYQLKQRTAAATGITEPVVDTEDAERAHNAQATLRSLRNVAERLASVRGRRKAILFVSEGIDYDVEDVFNLNSTNSNHSAVQQVKEEAREAIAAAMRANTSIYAIDPRGLTTLGEEDVLLGRVPGDLTLPINRSSLTNELRVSQNSLQTLSGETGAFAVVNRNDFSPAFDRIVADNSSYYVLAYYSQIVRRDDKFHKIDVRVTRSGVTVRSRRGYSLPRQRPSIPQTTEILKDASAEVRDALNGLLPTAGLAMNVSAAAFRGPASNVSALVTAELAPGGLKAGPRDTVELSYVAVDATGAVRGGGTDKIKMDLRPEIQGRVEQRGLRLLKRFSVPPGRYQVRVGARHTSSGAVGSVIYDLDAPDYNKLSFGISGILLTSMAHSGIVTTRPDEQTKGVLPAPPTAARTFPQNDQLALFAEVYDDGRAARHTVDIATRVKSDVGAVVFTNEEVRDSSELQGKRGAYGHTTRIPLADLQPGSYVLIIEARSRLGTKARVSRQISFAVEPRMVR